MAARPKKPTPIHCFICFEEEGPLLESSSISTCSCRFFVHDRCWETVKRTRAHQDQCPFCNKKQTVTPSAPPLSRSSARAPSPVPLFISIPDNNLPYSYQTLAAQPVAPPSRPRPTPRPAPVPVPAPAPAPVTVTLAQTPRPMQTPLQKIILVTMCFSLIFVIFLIIMFKITD